MDEVGALALPLVPGCVLRGLQDVAPLRLQPGLCVLLRGQRRDRARGTRDRYRHPAPERVQQPVGLVGGVQVVVEEPADRLPLHGRRVVSRGAHGRVSADEVVEPELAARGRGQQVMVEQDADGLLRLGEGAAAQGRRRVQADLSAGAHAQPPEELLMTGLKGAVGQVEGRHPLQACACLVDEGRRARQFRHEVAQPGRVVLSQPARGELDGEWQAPAHFHGRRHLVVVAALSRDPPEQRDRVLDGQHIQGQRRGIGKAGNPMPAGDQDQGPAAGRQQRIDLVQAGGVVQDHHGAAPAELGPPQRRALAERLGYLRGRHSEHLEQEAQRLGRVE